LTLETRRYALYSVPFWFANFSDLLLETRPLAEYRSSKAHTHTHTHTQHTQNEQYVPARLRSRASFRRRG